MRDANARAEAIVAEWSAQVFQGTTAPGSCSYERSLLVSLIQRELVAVNAEAWKAYQVLDPEGRFRDIEDAARNRMQVVLLANDHLRRCPEARA